MFCSEKKINIKLKTLFYCSSLFMIGNILVNIYMPIVLKHLKLK